MSSSFTSTDVRNELGSPSTSVVSSALLDNIISEEGTLLGSAARVSKILSRKFALKADKTLGDLKINYLKRAQMWQSFAEDLERDASLDVLPFAGGISKEDKETQEEDSDRVEPFFDREMFNYLEEESSL